MKLKSQFGKSLVGESVKPSRGLKGLRKEERKVKTKLEEKIEESDFFSYFIPWGSRDVARAVDVVNESNVNLYDVVDIIEEYGLKLEEVDIVAMVYQVILNEALYDIEQITNIDVVNDFGVYVYGNYLASSFDYRDELLEALEPFRKELGRVSKATKFFLDAINF